MGINLERLRSQSGVTLAALAEHLGMDKNELRAHEAARSLDKTKELEALLFCQEQQLEQEKRQADPGQVVTIKICALYTWPMNGGQLSNQIEIQRGFITYKSHHITYDVLKPPQDLPFKTWRAPDEVKINAKVDELRTFFEGQGYQVKIVQSIGYANQLATRRTLLEEGWRII